MTSTRQNDRTVNTVLDALNEQYGRSHRSAKISAYRYNPASVRVRIIDPSFRGKDLVEREQLVWPILEALPDNIRADITMLILVAPNETKTSLANIEFDHPSPSQF